MYGSTPPGFEPKLVHSTMSKSDVDSSFIDNENRDDKPGTEIILKKSNVNFLVLSTISCETRRGANNCNNQTANYYLKQSRYTLLHLFSANEKLTFTLGSWWKKFIQPASSWIEFADALPASLTLYVIITIKSYRHCHVMLWSRRFVTCGVSENPRWGVGTDPFKGLIRYTQQKLTQVPLPPGRKHQNLCDQLIIYSSSTGNRA